MQQLFETRIAVAETGKDKQDLAAFNLGKSLIKADVSCPPRGLFMRSRKVA